MKTTTLQNILISFLILLPLLAEAQTSTSPSSPRFQPQVGVTYNFHTIKFDPGNDIVIPDFHYSHFPGIEFGFKLSPENPMGWHWNYRNTFLGELAIYGIAEIGSNPYTGIINDVVNRTINNGFLGRLDVGKILVRDKRSFLQAGFSVSDKVIFGSSSYLPAYAYGPDSYTADGFHFTPGLFASYVRQGKRAGEFSLNLALSQSLFNLHQFDEDPYQEFVYPLFTELDIRYQSPSGFYFRAGALLATSFKAVQADARISAGIGYTFRNN